MKIYVVLAFIICAQAVDVKETKDTAEPAQNKDKRQTQDDAVHGQLVYRTARKQEQVAPVEEPQDDDRIPVSRSATEEYRPGQVYSLNSQELLELQPERKAPLASSQHLQQLYEPQEHKQNLQQFYYLEPQTARQVSLQPSHAVIARPHFSSHGGEASVGAALSVSDSGANPGATFDQELLALLGQSVRQEEPRQTYAQQSISTQSASPQYQQVDRYITKPSKKPTKLRTKAQVTPPQPSAAPQQYLIETTNVQQQQPQQQQIQYRIAQPQAQRPVQQAIRYTPVQPTAATQQLYYERPESQGLKIVPAPKLQQQQPRAQLNYRFIPQYEQAEATPKQYRIVEAPRLQPARQEPQRISAPSIERPVTYLKRFPEPEKVRAVKLYEQAAPEELRPAPQVAQPTQGEQYYLRPVYRVNERPRYELPAVAIEQARVAEPTKAPHSAIYVSKNLGIKKPARPGLVRVDQPVKFDQQYRSEVQYRSDQPSRVEQINIEQHGQSLDDQRSHLPPPRNNKAYTPEEFQALVAAGYAVTPIPVGSLAQQAQSRASVEAPPSQPQAQRRPLYSRRHQYLPLRSDEAP